MSHKYYSTACYHDKHWYCQSDTTLKGSYKEPAECKWCPAQCQCWCHTSNVLFEEDHAAE